MKVRNLTHKAETLAVAARKAEREVENDPRSKARNIKTAKSIK